MLVIGLTSQINAQVIELSEIEITAVNYKYLSAVDSKDVAIPVKALEEKVAMFDLKNAEFYVDEYDFYQVKFYIPDGMILASYDGDGKVIRTVERFKNVRLPNDVRMAIMEKYPNWSFRKDVYRVTYNDEKSTKEYKVVLMNGDKTMRVKLTDEGKFL